MPTVSVTKLKFAHSINSLLQIGDFITWFAKDTNMAVDGINSMSTEADGTSISLGKVVSIGSNFVCCEIPVGQTNLDSINQNPGFVTFHKNPEIEETGLKGYYADLIFTNDSNEKSELFSVSSEISLSSK